MRAKRPLLVVLCLLVGATAGACGVTGAGVSESSAAAVAGSPPGSRAYTVEVGGRRRSFFVYAFGQPRTKRPLVLVYHGAGENARRAEAETDFVSVARREGLIVAFMQGYADTWNEGAGHTPARVAGVNDVQFTAAALKRIEQRYPVDRSRIAATGMSNGALMTELLGCRLAGRLTVIMPVEGEIPASVSPGCRPQTPISVLEVHGTADSTIPYGGGHFSGVGGGTTVLSAPGSAARWAALDRCRRRVRAAAPGVRLTTYTSCRAGVVVLLRTIVGGHHEWPDGPGELVADFLRAHPRSAG